MPSLLDSQTLSWIDSLQPNNGDIVPQIGNQYNGSLIDSASKPHFFPPPTEVFGLLHNNLPGHGGMNSATIVVRTRSTKCKGKLFSLAQIAGGKSV